MKLTENGSPESPSMKQVSLPNKRKYPARIKDHPEWCHEDKPWSNYPHKTQHNSIENHYLYRLPSELGVGNYANLGTFRGGSAASIAHGLKKLGGGRVYSIDLFEVNGAISIKELEDIFTEREIMQYTQFCKGYTHEWAKRLKDIRFKFVFIDADHNYETCKQDFEMWSKLLEPEGQIAFHDVHLSTVDKVVSEIDLDLWEEAAYYNMLRTFKKRGSK